MALKRVEPGVSDRSLVTRVHREYKDLDLNFTAKPGTEFPDGKTRGDVYKKIDIKAIDQSIQNILLTNYYDKPFNPFFGANLIQLLFELNTTVSASMMEDTIRREIERHEPRVRVLDVQIYDSTAEKMVPKGASSVFFYSGSGAGGNNDDYTLVANVHCQILNTGIDFTTSVNMNRLR